MKEYVKRLLYFFRYLNARHVARKASYAQDGEDIKALEFLGEVRTFIDIGANDGYASSNSFLFSLRGATGVCLEPVPAIFKRLRLLHLLNSRVTCLNYGISEHDSQTEIVASGLLSYLPETQDQKLMEYLGSAYDKGRSKVSIRLISFATLAGMVDIAPETDLLSVDVEGHELQVLRSIDFEKYRFRLIIVETHARTASGETVWTHRDLADIEALLLRHGYRAVAASTINTFYMPRQD